jgi:hypothetical protein
MSKRLGDDDAQAVDLLLEHGGTAADVAAGAFLTSLSESVVDRVGIVESVFRLLSEMPAPEPPADLVQRTVERCQHAGIVPAAAAQAEQPPLVS